ncbi:adenylate/guanylate cyclase domain-containing protein [Mesorhizobium sp. M0437]|uniref:adenylate/guanylate cyclase domain-containing protein n=1 Tax=Mesorhizobium sp. M0437 TaxID=2956945 RepID=UPI00333AA794
MERRLAAILFADIVGFSRLVEASEAATIAAIRTRHSTIVEPLVSTHKGRVVKLIGDGVLLEFASAVGAVECGIELQTALIAANGDLPDDKKIIYRIGISLGDVVVQNDDLFGEGVNIAARLQQIAEPGTVFVSEAVFSQARGKGDFHFDDIGVKDLKNISQTVRVFRVRRGQQNSATAVSAVHSKITVAVLPFANVSGDPEQGYFSDGITEDIITDLSKISALDVLSRHTAFAFRDRTNSVSQIAQRLKVSYLLEGSVRRSGGRIRISAQIVDAVGDTHIWAERYDRDLRDVFEIQDELSKAIVAALRVKLLPTERRALEFRSTYDSEAYRLYLMGRRYFVLRGVRNYQIALRFCRRALEVDPSYARAWALSALCLSYLHQSGRATDSGLDAARQATILDPTLAEAHAAMGRILAERGEFEAALCAHQESRRLEPDSFDVHHNFGITYLELGRHEDSLQHFEEAARLLESDHSSLNLLALAQRSLGRNDEFTTTTYRALERIEREIAARPDNANALAHGALAWARLGENERALEWADRALIIEPDDLTDQYNLACAMAQSGEREKALSLLESCLPKMPAEFGRWLANDLDLEPLRGHQQYQSLITSVEQRLALSLQNVIPAQSSNIPSL